MRAARREATGPVRALATVHAVVGVLLLWLAYDVWWGRIPSLTPANDPAAAVTVWLPLAGLGGVVLAVGALIGLGRRVPWLVALGVHGGAVTTLALSTAVTPRLELLVLEAYLVPGLLLPPLIRALRVRPPRRRRRWLSTVLLVATGGIWLLLLGLAAAAAPVTSDPWIRVLLPALLFCITCNWVYRAVVAVLAGLVTPPVLLPAARALRRRRDALALELAKQPVPPHLQALAGDLARTARLRLLAQGEPVEGVQVPSLCRYALVPDFVAAGERHVLDEIEMADLTALTQLREEARQTLQRLLAAAGDLLDPLHVHTEETLAAFVPRTEASRGGRPGVDWMSGEGLHFLEADAAVATSLNLLGAGHAIAPQRLAERAARQGGGTEALELIRRAARVLECVLTVLSTEALQMADDEMRELAFFCVADAYLEVDSIFARKAGLTPGRMRRLLDERREFIDDLMVIWVEHGRVAEFALRGVIQVLIGRHTFASRDSAEECARWWQAHREEFDADLVLAAEGLLLLEADDLDEALRKFEKAAEIAPGSDLALENLCTVLCRAGKFDEAEEHARSWVRQARGEATPTILLGRVLEARGHLQEAAEAYRSAERAGASSSLSYRIGALSFRLGDLAEADRRFRQLLRQPREQEGDRSELAMWLSLICFARGDLKGGLEVAQLHARRLRQGSLVEFLVEGLEVHDLSEGQIGDILYRLAMGPLTDPEALEEVALYLESSGDYPRAREVHNRARWSRGEGGEAPP